MTNEITKTINWDGKFLEISTGKIANEADGAVIIKMGESIVLCTCVAAREHKDVFNYFPLTVNYREMSSAAGKIPGGFIKREGKNSEKEVLVSRLIDRPLRPSFHPDFLNETQVICTVLSYDSDHPTDILAIIGASACLAVSGIPYQNIIGAVRVGLINGEFIINPSSSKLKESKLDLVIAGTEHSLMMVESEAELLSENQMLKAIKLGHDSFQPVIQMINELAAEVNKPKWEVTETSLESLKDQITLNFSSDIAELIEIKRKKDRAPIQKALILKAINLLTQTTEYTNLQIENTLLDVIAYKLRQHVLEKSIRFDGRKGDEIRKISGEVSFLPKTHGSALFTRGETQALVVATLGTSYDEQIVDSLDGEFRERFMLNYIFPPYAVGEVSALRAPGRREIGHGKLAWRSLNRIMPSKEEFPYSVRVVSEITSCNGSSSMATICGATMALMDAGVEIKTPIAGIAMGLIKENDKYLILSDIVAYEDAIGDMDFKVAGGQEGITALQMDLKVSDITFEIIEKVLHQAKLGRQFILNEMLKTISKTNNAISQYAPAMHTMKIDKGQIREVIGTGGKTIREIIDTTGAKIDINDEGIVTISGSDKDKVDAAIAKINLIVLSPKVGDIFKDCKVVKVLDSIAFINYVGNKEGVLHVSEFSEERTPSLEKVLKDTDKVTVKVIGFDMKGKAKLSLRLSKTVESKKENTNAAVTEPSSEEVNENKEPRRPKKWKSAPSSEPEVKTERKYFS